MLIYQIMLNFIIAFLCMKTVCLAISDFVFIGYSLGTSTQIILSYVDLISETYGIVMLRY